MVKNRIKLHSTVLYGTVRKPSLNILEVEIESKSLNFHSWRLSARSTVCAFHKVRSSRNVPSAITQPPANGNNWHCGYRTKCSTPMIQKLKCTSEDLAVMPLLDGNHWGATQRKNYRLFHPIPRKGRWSAGKWQPWAGDYRCKLSPAKFSISSDRWLKLRASNSLLIRLI